jgi:hypothetical protein
VTNPAHELLVILRAWNKDIAAQTVYAVRDMDPSSKNGWDEVLHATQLLVEVGACVQELASETDVSAWQRHQPAWAKAVLLPEEQWSDRSSLILGQDSLDALQFLDQYLTIARPKLSVSEQSRVAALDVITVALEDIIHVDLQENEREYITALLNSADDALREKTQTGTIDLKKRLDEVSGALLRIGALLSHEGEKVKGEKFAKLAITLSIARAGLYDVAALAAIGSLGLDSVLAINS